MNSEQPTTNNGKPDREYRGMTMTAAEPRLGEQAELELFAEGYAAIWEQPYVLFKKDGITYYEVIARGALDGADLSDVVMRYDHHGKVLARTANGTLRLTVDDKGLRVLADLSKSKAAAELHEEIRNRLITKMSWGFTTDKDAFDRDTRTRTITKIKKVYDVSAVTIPANDGTDIAARARIDGEIEAERREALARRVDILSLKIKLGGIQA